MALNIQGLPGGINGDHRVFSNFYSDNSIIQQVATVQPKNLLIDSLRKTFALDNIYTYRADEFGFPLVTDLTGGDIDSENTTKILITDTYRYELKFYPAITIKAGNSQYKPLSFNQEGTVKYRRDQVEDEFGSRRVVSTPTHRVYAGRWDSNFEITLLSESQTELEALADIVTLVLQYTLWNELRANGLFIYRLSIGPENAEPYANDYVYNRTISISTYSEWRVEIPIDSVIEKLVFYFESTLHPIPGEATAADALALKFDDVVEMAEII